MRAEIFKTLWGHSGPIEDAIAQVQAAGFDGLEGAAPMDATQRKHFGEAIRAAGLSYIGEISTTGYAIPDPGSSVQQHVDAFEQIMDRTLEVGPRFFSSMAGNDLWSFAESIEFLTRAQAIVEDRGVRCGFETHRSRTLYHPVRTLELLREAPPLEITLDLSHWCVVTERLPLDELPEVLALCAERTLHIQPRVGYDQGAQVPDPRAPEHAGDVEAHFRWWQEVWAGQKARGFEVVTMTPEFGPDGYLHCEPFTQKPVGDLWEINTYMGNLARKRFEEWLALA